MNNINTTNKKKYDLIVFDWDGTLYDSADHILGSLRKAVTDLKQPMFDEEEYRSIFGLPVMRIIDVLYADASEIDRSNIKTRYQFHALLNQKEVILYPHAKEVLNALKNNGYLLAVATGKSAQGLARDLENIQLMNFFDITRTADKTAMKPDPMMLNEIMQILGVSYRRTLMVGDSIADIQLANNADVDSVGIDHNITQREYLISQGAKAAIGSLDELLVFLGVE